MQHRLIILAVATSLMGAADFAATPQIASDLELMILDKGATYAFSKMTKPQFEHALTEAAKGHPEWLQVAADLLPGTDGANSEAIEGSLSAALQTAPADVLNLLQNNPSRLQVNWIWEDRTIESKAAEVRAYRFRATRALQNITEPSLRTLRDTCLASVRKTSEP